MKLTLRAPLDGWVAPLAEVPDAAFAEGLVGDGVAIDPLGSLLHAPCAGEVVAVHASLHAVTLRSDSGAEILCHVGIETVGLRGKGFAVHVAVGDRVDAGARLLSFDLDVLADGARSLISPILVIDQEAFRITRRAHDVQVTVGDWLMDLEFAGAADQPAISTGHGPVHTRSVVLPHGHGIHARPAAAIVACARRFDASVELATERATAPATSAVALMTLGLGGGDRAMLNARGADAEAALEALAFLIETELDGERAASPAVAPSAKADGRGVTAVPGIAIGSVARLRPSCLEPPAEGQGIAVERPALRAALAEVRAALQVRTASGSRAQADIARAHLALLDDPRLYAAANEAIEKGASAGAAWREAIAPELVLLRAVADDRIAGRADDLVDLERQVVAATLGASATAADLPDHAILVAGDLLPSELMSLNISSLAGIALAGGGPTSHVAIIAAAHAIPMVVALGEDVLMLEDASRVVLDAGAGTIVTADHAAEAAARTKIKTTRDRRAAAQGDAAAPCHLADGTRIEIFANLGSLEDAKLAMDAGAEGCGLLRTELLFLDRDAAPDEDEQLALYSAIAARLEGRPLIIRTLDIGGDKPVRYVPIPAEENPALGLRGIRVGLEHPHLLDAQLRAILRAGAPGQCRILLPMVASVDEVLAVRARAEAAAADVGYPAPVAIGVMIETPAAAITADLLAPAADFFAIGTNDLAQYTLAMDRGNPAVAGQVDGLHPSVLRLIQAAAAAGAEHGRPVGVCGGLASDLVAAPILIGLGVSELSAVPGVIPELKARVRTLTRAACVELAARAVQQSSATAVRALAGELS